MDEYIRVTAKTVEDAILEASIALGTSSDNIEYHIIERETKGFLGIGAKKAVIEARRKMSDEDIINEVFRGKEAEPAKKARKKEESSEKKAAKKTEKKQVKETVKSEKKEEKAAAKAEKKPEKSEKEKAEKAEKSEKAVKKAVKEEKASGKEDKKSEQKEQKSEKKAAKAEKKAEKAQTQTVPVKEEQESAAETTPRVPADPEVVKSRAEEFLSSMLSAMGVQASIETTYEDGTLNVNLEGDDMGILIGKRGQTLDSIQYLTSLVVNKGKAAYVRVKIDTENYRERRKATLENLAKNMAFKVKKTRRPAYLEPMNPYERRIIHSALQNDPYVTTHSEGEEPARKVVITLRKHERDEAGQEE